MAWQHRRQAASQPFPLNQVQVQFLSMVPELPPLVAPELRRKRIGRVMLEELSGLAAKMERDWLIVEKARGASEFFKRIGFIESDNQMVRRVRR